MNKEDDPMIEKITKAFQLVLLEKLQSDDDVTIGVLNTARNYLRDHAQFTPVDTDLQDDDYISTLTESVSGAKQHRVN
ncbi:MAG: hypothetical protein ABW127_09830 [Candidatus Thiodiazotropha endolucinida]